VDAGFTLTSEPVRPAKKRVPRDPRPRFKPDRQDQIDLIWGHLDSQVPPEHLVRAIWGMTELFDVSSVEARYSALGRRGYPPRRLLGLWLYASLVGEHEASKVAVRARADVAMRWVCGGNVPSVATIKRFRHSNLALFEAALVRTIELAIELNLVDVADLAVDSVRLRAHASLKEARTLERSTKRLKELEAASTDAMTEMEREKHAGKVKKHSEAVAKCEAEGRTNVVLTNPEAGLLKGPYGASFPGHRVTVTAAGLQSRLVLSILIDADGTDHGKLIPSLREARRNLQAAGHDLKAKLVAAADAGYFSSEGLREAERESDWLEVLVAPIEGAGRTKAEIFGRDRFVIVGNQPPICPAGRPMSHAGQYANGEVEWIGVGCRRCPLVSQCTSSKHRNGRRLKTSPPLEEMRLKMARPENRARYNRRIGTVEPVFAHLVDTMGYRRATTRHPAALRAEITLKCLAHNVARLLVARRLRLVRVVLDLF
jgi:transposase